MFKKLNSKYLTLIGTLFVVAAGVFLETARPIIAADATSQTSEQQGGPKAAAGGKGGTSGRWEGRVVRSSKEQSTLTVRKSGSSLERTCAYDSSTKWVSQYHADKKVNDIDASQVKDGDYVICKGTSDSAGVIHSTLISRRLSHSQ